MWLKTSIMIALIFGISACKESEKNSTKIETLKIKEIWQGDIPVKYQELLEVEGCDDGNGSKINLKDTFLLLPNDIESSSPLNIELFGCWALENTLECSSDSRVYFNSLEVIKQNTNKLLLSVTQKRYVNKTGACELIVRRFRKRYTQDINGSWEKGELQIVLNQDDENLSATVIVN